MNIILIEDDLTLNKNITEALEAEKNNVLALFDGSLLERKLAKNDYDCLILDVNLPGKNGFEICKDVRKMNSEIPIIMLTAFADIDDKIAGFQSGADDYLTKPFLMKELLIRIESLVKRKQIVLNKNIDVLQYDDIMLHQSQKKVFRQEQEINLTPREYNILLKLLQNPTDVVSKKELINTIWGQSVDFNTNTIEVYINFLRNKIDKPFGKNTIKTKIGFGYYLEKA